jgi:BlaI family transcriptional regulator, penicillinase repressor
MEPAPGRLKTTFVVDSALFLTTLVVVVTEQLTDLQLSVMKALWQIREGTVGDVLSALATDERELAPTTVATLLQRLSKQGWVAYRKNGRQFLYRAAVEQKDAAHSGLQRVLRAFFSGKASLLTAQLLETERLTSTEVSALKKLLDHKGR